MNCTIDVVDKKNTEIMKSFSGKKRLEIMRCVSARAHSFILRRVSTTKSPPNSPLTVAIKKGNNPLRDTGRLLASITYRASESQAVVGSNHIAALMNHPEDGKTQIEIKPKNAKWLTIPAGSKTRTMMRRFGFTPKACIDGMKGAGYSIYRPFKKGSNTVRATVIMAQEKGAPRLKSGKKSSASKWQPFVLFILKKSIKVPVRRFLYLDETELKAIGEFIAQQGVRK
jgi:phage gpG-like protein